MLSISLLFSAFVAVTQMPADTSVYPVKFASGINKTLMLKLVNDVRTKGCNCGDKYYSPVPALVWNTQLEQAASNHSNDMFNNSYFNHKNKEGKSSGDRMKEVGYKWSAAGENIGHGYANENAVVEGWLNSPGHCANIMTVIFKEIGVAKSGTYWTMDLATK